MSEHKNPLLPGQRVLVTGLKAPEGPVWMKDGSVAYVEIGGGTVSRVKPDGVVEVIARPGGGPNGLAVGPDGFFYLCNNGGSVWRESNGVRLSVHGALPPDYVCGSIQKIDPKTGKVELLYDRCDGNLLCGPNDLVFDTHGGFYFTDYGKIRGRVRDIGGVYYAKADGSGISEIIYPIANPNGIGLSPDQRTLYVAETETARLWSFGIKAPGELEKLPFPSPHGGKLICGLGGYHRLDSLAVDAAGNVCVATLMSGEITVVSPGGDIVRRVRFPDIHTTNICFGGPDLMTAYVTQTSSGRLVEMPWDQPGLRLNYEI